MRPLSGLENVEKPVSGPRPMNASWRLPSAFGSWPVPIAQSPPPCTVPVSPTGAVPSGRQVSPPSTDTEPWSVPLLAPFVPQLYSTPCASAKAADSPWLRCGSVTSEAPNARPVSTVGRAVEPPPPLALPPPAPARADVVTSTRPSYGCGVAFVKPQASAVYVPAGRSESVTFSSGELPSLLPSTAPSGPRTVRTRSLTATSCHLMAKRTVAVTASYAPSGTVSSSACSSDSGAPTSQLLVANAPDGHLAGVAGGDGLAGGRRDGQRAAAGVGGLRGGAGQRDEGEHQRGHAGQAERGAAGGTGRAHGVLQGAVRPVFAAGPVVPAAVCRRGAGAVLPT